MSWWLNCGRERATAVRGGAGLGYGLTTILILLGYNYNIHLMDFVLVYYHCILTMGNDVKKYKPLMMFDFILCLTKYGYVCPFLHLFIVTGRAGNLDKRFVGVHAMLEDRIEVFFSGMAAYNLPLAGVNVGWDWIDELIVDWKRELNALVPTIKMSELLCVTVEASFLRSVGRAVSILELSQRPPLNASDSYNYALRIAKYQKITGWAILGGVGFIFASKPALIFAIILYGLYLVMEVGDSVETSRKMGPKVKDGSYMVNFRVFGVPVSHGIGVAHNGILHVPYHVSGSADISLGKGMLVPYYISIEEDLVTYGGPPQLRMPTIGQVVYVNIETKDSRTTYRTRVDVDHGSRILTWCNMTAPGESGSPMYIEDDDGVHLVGLVGRWVSDQAGNVTGYTKLPQGAEDTSLVPQQILTHPGSGKTRKKLPDLIMRYLDERRADNRRKKILVAGPTRVVAKEIYTALIDKVRVGLSIKDEAHLRNPHALVQVTTHHTAMNLLLTDAREVRDLGCLIIDEAHADDSSTIMLREYGRHLLDARVAVVEMSATLDGITDNNSNYHIEDIKLKEKEMYKAIRECAKEGNKMMIFVPSLNGNIANEVVKCLPEKPLKLSRATYSTVAGRLNDDDVKVILTTDIAEMGLNVKDLKIVFDFGKKYGYFVNGNNVEARTVNLSKASQVQRRGRVGRMEPGTYYYCNEPSDEGSMTAAELDANIMMAGQGWAGYRSNPMGITLDKRQVERCFREMELPTYVALATGSDGRLLGKREILRNIEYVRSGKEYWAGCDRRDCCEGTYQWFDERIHDFLVSAVDVPHIIRM